jgi:hypothetical protein
METERDNKDRRMERGGLEWVHHNDDEGSVSVQYHNDTLS